MDDLSGDEASILVISAIGAAIFSYFACRTILMTSSLGRSPLRRFPLIAGPLIGLIAVAYVVSHWADKEVLQHSVYQILFLLLGILWVGMAARLMPLVGLRIREDAVERDNPAVAVAAGGALLGVLLTYAGANIGGGATIWSTILPAILATALWFILWLLITWFSRASEAIALDRDTASGWRLGGSLLAMGLILGRAMAGDFHSADETLRDFTRDGWPAILVMMICIFLQRAWRPTPQIPRRNAAIFGAPPAVVLVIAGMVFVKYLGDWR